jgi:hypothetical protein
VISLLSEDAFENAQALTLALKQVISRFQGWALAPGDYSLEVMTAALNCPEVPDAACLVAVAQAIKSDRFVWGIMKRDGNDVVADVHLWEWGSEKSRAEVRYSSELKDASQGTLLDMAAQTFEKLLAGREGKLVVHAGKADGEVLVDGAPRAKLVNGKAELMVLSGEVTIAVRAPGFELAQQAVTIGGGTTSELTLELVATDRPAPPPDDTKDREAAKRAKTRRTVGYGALAAGAALAGVGTAFWVQSYQQTKNNEWQRFREEVAKDEDPCIRAPLEGRQDIDDLCKRNKRARLLAQVLVPSGVVAAGVGTVLLFTSQQREHEAHAPKAARFTLYPYVGGDGASLDVRYDF